MSDAHHDLPGRNAAHGYRDRQQPAPCAQVTKSPLRACRQVFVALILAGLPVAAAFAEGDGNAFQPRFVASPAEGPPSRCSTAQSFLYNQGEGGQASASPAWNDAGTTYGYADLAPARVRGARQERSR